MTYFINKKDDARPHNYVRRDFSGKYIMPENKIIDGSSKEDIAWALYDLPFVADFESATRKCLDGTSIRPFIFNPQTEKFSRTAGKQSIVDAIGDALYNVPWLDKEPSRRDRNGADGNPLPSFRDDGMDGAIAQWHHEFTFTEGKLMGQTLSLYMKAFIPNGAITEDNPVVIACHPDRNK